MPYKRFSAAMRPMRAWSSGAIGRRPPTVFSENGFRGLAGLLGDLGGGAGKSSEGLFDLVVPIQLKRRGVEAKLVMKAAGDQSSPPDAKLVTLLADALRWIDDIAQGRALSLRGLARQNNRDAGEISRTLPLAFLAPDIVEAVLKGRQPASLTPRQLKRIGDLPRRWDDQRRCLGFRPAVSEADPPSLYRRAQN